MSIIEIVPGKTRVGWIGTGVMGRSMVGHLIDKGFAATVYNRSKDKAQASIDKGGGLYPIRYSNSSRNFSSDTRTVAANFASS